MVGKNSVWEGGIRTQWLFANSEANGVVFACYQGNPGILVCGGGYLGRCKLWAIIII